MTEKCREAQLRGLIQKKQLLYILIVNHKGRTRIARVGMASIIECSSCGPCINEVIEVCHGDGVD